ncbi:hypothetical protein LSH36_27g07050 [Paralvinella palmiformis]|uniref:BBSome-interacting protein 1 n=1 Tax=Paralvinella palmiformis TaxID=53620 RepID=A0AAD9KA17_9ANNE|nr:hypothetical protein LSH36_27g07050 [Paralvinella palmiformis]
MSSASTTFQEVLPKQGLLYNEEIPATVLCKPKLLPLKSVTLEKLERMQKEAQEKVREQEKQEELQQKDVFGLPSSDFSM